MGGACVEPGNRKGNGSMLLSSYYRLIPISQHMMRSIFVLQSDYDIVSLRYCPVHLLDVGACQKCISEINGDIALGL